MRSVPSSEPITPRSRLFYPTPVQNTTPGLVYSRSPPELPFLGRNPKEGLSCLQKYLHRQILAQMSMNQEARKQKEIEADIREREDRMQKQEEKRVKMRQQDYIQMLSVRLKELQGELQVQQKKVQLQYRLHDRMMQNYSKIFGKLQNRGSIEQKRSQNPRNSMTKPAKVTRSGKVLLRKFRIAGLVVFFALLFPKYVRRFNIKRKELFFRDYQDGEKLQDELNLFQQRLMNLKIYRFWKQLERKNRKEERGGTEHMAFMHYEQVDTDGNTQTFGFRLSNVPQLVTFVLQKIKNLLVNGEIDGFVQTMAETCTRQSFLADYCFTDDQLYQIRINHNWNYLMFSQQIEGNLLLKYLLLKIVVKKYFFGCVQNEQWRKICTSSKSIKQKTGMEMSKLQRHLPICAAYLTKLFISIGGKPVRQKIPGNLQKHALSFPLPFEQMRYGQEVNEGIDFQKQQRLFQNLQQFDDLVTEIREDKRQQKCIKQIIEEIKAIIQKKCKQIKNEKYWNIHNMLLNQRYFLTKDIKQECLVLQRTEQQKKQIQMLIRQFTKCRPKVKKSSLAYKQQITSKLTSQNNMPNTQSSKSNPSRESRQMIRQSLSNKQKLQQSSQFSQIRSSLHNQRKYDNSLKKLSQMGRKNFFDPVINKQNSAISQEQSYSPNSKKNKDKKRLEQQRKSSSDQSSQMERTSILQNRMSDRWRKSKQQLSQKSEERKQSTQLQRRVGQNMSKISRREKMNARLPKIVQSSQKQI